MTTAHRVYPPFEDKEIAEGMRFLRTDKRYADLVPDAGVFKIDFFLLRAISNEIERRRTPSIKLALLTGTVVREFIPDDSPERRRLGMAYRDAIMAMFRRRKHFQNITRTAEAPATEHPCDQPQQYRLI